MSEKIKILYVDDEPINLMLFEHTFQAKYDTKTAKSGWDGLEELHNDSEIKIVISDMRMPGMNGLEFITQAKEMYPHILFYILTGYDISDEIANALKNGLINRYFQKPFKMKEIDKAISEAFNIHT